jgi:hypothetical protein
MKNAYTLREVAGSMSHEDRYSVELARGGSHIASTRSLVTLKAAVVDVLEEFTARHRAADCAVFLDLLAVRLEKRELPYAAAIVRRVAVVGIEKAFEEATDTGRKDSIPQTKKKAPARRSTTKTK